MATWPSTLPGIEIGAEMSQQDSVVKSPTEFGPGKQRKRYTATSQYYSGTMLVTKDQRDKLQDFFQNTVGFGAIPFDFTSPEDNSTLVPARFMSPPSYSALVGGPDGVALWRASIQLEILPV